tara:strand:+ start:898 stop:2814 length:1917 start_codon:yes stop_codon:yes gene_type:complete
MAEDINNIQTLQRLLFPNGAKTVPTSKELLSNLKDGSLTVREALLIHIKSKKIRIGANIVKSQPIAEEMLNIFGEGSTSLTTFANRVKKFEDILDSSYFKFTEDITEEGQKTWSTVLGKQVAQDISAIDTDVFKLARDNKISIARQELKKVVQSRGGKAFKQVPTPDIVWPKIMEAAQEIALDPRYGPNVAKGFILSAILPIRGTDLSDITMSRAFSEGLTTVRPYISRTPDGNLKITLPSMEGRGQKRIVDFVFTPFLKNLLEPDFIEAKKNKSNYLFDKVIKTKKDGETKLVRGFNTKILTEASNNYFGPLLSEYEDILGRPYSGISDIRKIAASTIAKHPDVNSPAIASQLLGHTNDANFVEGLSKIDTKSYISDMYEPGAVDKLTRTVQLYESLIAKSIGTVDINDIALRSNLPVFDDTIKINLINKTDEIQEIVKLTPAELSSRKKYIKSLVAAAIASQEQKAAGFKLKTEEDLTKANLLKEERLKGKTANINLNSSVMRSILDKSGVDIKELRNKTNKEIMEILNKAMKGGKAVAPFVPYAGVAYGVGNVLLSGKESFADIPPEEQTMPTKVVRGAAELFGKDPEAAVMGARVVEEAVSPVPATAFPRKDEEIVPFGEQLERLVPFGGIRGR